MSVDITGKKKKNPAPAVDNLSTPTEFDLFVSLVIVFFFSPFDCPSSALINFEREYANKYSQTVCVHTDSMLFPVYIDYCYSTNCDVWLSPPPSRSTFVPSLSMTQPKTTSFPVRRQAFASGWGTLFRSSPRTTTTGGRESWRILRTGRQASSHHQSCRSGKEQRTPLLALLDLVTLMLIHNIMAPHGKSKNLPWPPGSLAY